MTLKDMLPIPINDFITALALPADLYFRLSEEKFIMLCKAGTKTSIEQLSSYKDKEVHYVWIRKTDYYKLSHQTIAIAGLAVRKGDLDIKQKTTVVSAAAKTVFHQLEHMGVSISLYNDAKMVTDVTISMIETHKKLSTLFEGLNDCSDDLLKHSMAVAILSAMIGVGLGWEKKLTIEKLTLGGLLHDIGLKTIAADILSKPSALMSLEETQIYETHSYRSMQLLTSLGIVPDDIISIVYQHHENAIGQGYPQRIRDVKTHPLARIVALANCFVDLTFSNVNCPNPKSPRDALMYLEHTLGLPYNREAFRALHRIVESNTVKAA